MVDERALEAELYEIGKRLAAAMPRHPQPAEGVRREGDGPRLAGRRAQGRAVPLRRRRARLPQPRRPRPPPDRLPRRGRDAAAADRRRDEDGQLEGGPRGAGRGGRRRRASTWRTASSSARTRRPRWACCATCGRTASRRSVDLLGEATVTAGRGRSATPTAAPTRSTRWSARRARWPARPQLERDSAGAAPAREPVGEGLGADAAAAARRARARQARRRRPPAPAAAPRARARRAPAHRHGVDGLARRGARAGPRAARRGGVPRRPVGRASCSRPTCATRPATLDTILDWLGRRRARAPADRPARQGRLLGPRDRRGAPARLGRAGVRGQGRLRPQLRGADPPAARRAAGRARGDRLAQPALGRATRSPTTG